MSPRVRTFLLLLAVAALPSASVAGGADLAPQPASTKVPDSCVFNGIELKGKVQVVEHFPDLKVKVVQHFPDLKVKTVQHFPDDCGEWQFVEHFPDFKIQYVEHFPDIEIQYVEHFPGVP